MNIADLHESIALLMARVGAQARLRPELTRAWREFSGDEGRLALPVASLAAPEHTRFAEWFLLERRSDALGEVPIRLAASLLGAEPPTQEVLETACVGVFLVVAVQPDIVRVADLQSSDSYDLLPTAELQPAVGDLLIGRLFTERAGVWLPSPAMAVVAVDEPLNRALRSDFSSVQLQRRLSQLELEHMLFRRSRAAHERVARQQPIEHLEAQLDQQLQAAGALRLSATEISQSLRDTTRPGAVIGPVLDEVAFATGADIERVRVLLTELWNAHRANATRVASAPTAPLPSEPLASGFTPREGESLGEALARRIEEGQRRHENLDTIYAEIEDLLGEPIEDDEPDDEPEASVDVFARGDLQALVQEFLWEERCEDGDEARVLGLLLSQQRQAPVPKANLEYLDNGDLLRLVVHVYLGSPPAERAAAVRRTFTVLQRFYRWAETTQEYEFGDVLESCRRSFIDDLDRVHRASLALSRTMVPGAGPAQPILMRVAELAGDEACLQHMANATAWVGVGAAAVDLRPGDVILGVLKLIDADNGSLDGMVMVLPAAAESALG